MSRRAQRALISRGGMWLEPAYQRRDIAISYLKTSQAFKGMRSDPRFVVLLEKMGL